MKEKAKYVRQMFSNIADDYDLFNSLFSFNRDSYWRKFAVSQAAMGSRGIAADIATGTGKVARELVRQNGKQSKVIGIDFCDRMLAKAKDKTRSTTSEGAIELVLADAQSLPFPNNVFDCATISFALRNVTSIEDTFREMARVVKEGGRVVSLELTCPPRGLFSKIYRFYLRNMAPLVGGIMSRRKEAYVYLHHSIEELPSPEEVKLIMEEVGLKEVRIYNLTLGTSVVHVGTK